MARSYSVAIYILKIKETGESKSEINLNTKCGFNKTSFYDFLESFVKKYSSVNYENKDSDQLLKIDYYIKDTINPFFMDGIVKKGDSGYEATLYNKNNHTERTRDVDDAELLPYYFCLAETHDPNSVVLCIQRSGNIGVKTIFQESIKKTFRDIFSDKHVLIINDHLPNFCKENFIKNNKVKKITYNYTAKISDIATALEMNGGRDYRLDDAYVKVTICPARSVEYRLKNISDGIKTILSKVESNIVNLDDSKKTDTSITFEGDSGKTRTFSINENKDILPYVDITNEITEGPNGHPVFDNIKNIVCDILKKDNLIK